MLIMITAAALAAQVPAATNSPAAGEPMQHMQMGERSKHDGMDCHKCCEEMMAKMHADHQSKHDGRSHP